jgi:endonuclease YncB( thermonuclease family)
VAEIYANGQNVNLQLVQEGYAVVYTQFLRSCPETSSALQAAEAQAQPTVTTIDETAQLVPIRVEGTVTPPCQTLCLCRF